MSSMRAWGTSQAELIRLPPQPQCRCLSWPKVPPRWCGINTGLHMHAMLYWCAKYYLGKMANYVVVSHGPHFENKMLTDEYRTLRRPKWWTLDYPVLRLSHIDDDFGEVVDHECYGNCRLSHCFWPNGLLDKGIARMQENYRRKKNNKRDD